MRILLLLMIFFIAVTSLISGITLVILPDGELFGMPSDMLSNSGFDDYFIPGLLLLFTVALSNVVAGVALVSEWRSKLKWTFIAGLTVTGWVVVQVLLLNTLLWIQYLYLGMGICIMLLSLQLNKKWLV